MHVAPLHGLPPSPNSTDSNSEPSDKNQRSTSSGDALRTFLISNLPRGVGTDDPARGRDNERKGELRRVFGQLSTRSMPNSQTFAPVRAHNNVVYYAFTT